MSYIKDNLLASEKIIYLTHIHWIIFATPIGFFLAMLVFLSHAHQLFPGIMPFINIPLAIVVILVCVIAGIVTGLGAIIQYCTSEYGITNKRILMKVGWIRRNSLELFIDKVEGIYVDQSVLGRLLGYGTIRIVGMGGTQDPFFLRS